MEWGARDQKRNWKRQVVSEGLHAWIDWLGDGDANDAGPDGGGHLDVFLVDLLSQRNIARRNQRAVLGRKSDRVPEPEMSPF